MLNGLDLFSGIGGITVALLPWVRPIAYCEIDDYARRVLISRMADGTLPVAPIWDDVRTLQGGRDLLPVDIIYGGFPCQDISIAGHGRGLAGERSGLVFEILRLIDECKPAFVFLENVPAIRTRGAERVVGELATLGYDCRWDCLSAYDMGAPHRRERWWLLAAHPKRIQLRDKSRRRGRKNWQGASIIRDDGEASPMADAEGERWSEGRTECEIRTGESQSTIGDLRDSNDTRLEVRQSWNAGQQQAVIGADWWVAEPDVGRVVNGLPNRVDRIKCLGNSVVPAQAREAFIRLMGLNNAPMAQEDKP